VRTTVDVEIPDARFKKGMVVVFADGTNYYVKNVHSSASPESALTGRGGAMQYEHEYTLVVQKSPVLRPGTVVLASEPGGWVSKCNLLRSWNGSIVAADSVDTIMERARKPAMR
jgi:hypothetical protein